MNPIEEYMAGRVDADTAIAQETLTYAVQRQITCARTDKVLDVRSAVYLRVEVDGTAGAECVDGPAWDAMAATVRAACEKAGATLEVIDGRALWGGA